MSRDALLLAGYVSAALSVSFYCSILEAALLSIRVSELEERREAGQRAAGVLLRLKQERIGEAISAVLILNTIAHTIGATLAGAQAALVFGSGWVGLFSAALTLAVLVGTEIVPKTLGTTHASRLVPFVASSLRALMWLLGPILQLTSLLTRLLTPERHDGISRGELAALIALAARQGAIPAQESHLLENVLALGHLKVEDVMTPRTVLVMLPADATLSDLVGSRETSSVSRIPLYLGTRDHVVGYLLQREALLQAARGASPETPLREFNREIPFLLETTLLNRALRTFLERREQIAMVVDEYGGVSGLVTLEDLVETILGVEIVDESDRVADLRALAVDLRDRRLARHAAPPAGDG